MVILLPLLTGTRRFIHTAGEREGLSRTQTSHRA